MTTQRVSITILTGPHAGRQFVAYKDAGAEWSVAGVPNTQWDAKAFDIELTADAIERGEH